MLSPKKKVRMEEKDTRLLKVNTSTRRTDTRDYGCGDAFTSFMKVANNTVSNVQNAMGNLTQPFTDSVVTEIVTSSVKQGPLATMLSESLVERTRKSFVARSAMPVIYITCKLNTFQHSNLEKTFSEFRFEQKDVMDARDHSCARLTRKASEEFIERILLNIDGKSSAEPGRFLLKDVGASLVKGIMSGDTRRHFCAPDPKFTGFSDIKRRAEADELVSRRSASLDSGVKELMDAYRAKTSKYFCSRLAQFCTEKALYQKFLFVHDMTMEEMCTSMLVSESQAGAGCVLFNPMILLNNKGRMEHSKCTWLRFMQDGVEKIKFCFDGDSQVCYVHDFNSYVKFMKRSYVEVQVGGVKKGYAIQFMLTDVDVLFFKILPCNYTVKGSCIHRALHLNMYSAYTVVSGFMYKLSGVDSRTVTTKSSKYLEPFMVTCKTSLYEAIVQYAMSRTTDFTIQKIVQAALVLNGRTNCSGTSFIYSSDNDSDRLSQSDLFKVCVSVYLQTHRIKAEMLETVAIGVEDQKRVKDVRKSGALRRILERSNAPDLESVLKKEIDCDDIVKAAELISRDFPADREHGIVLWTDIKEWVNRRLKDMFPKKSIYLTYDVNVFDNVSAINLEEFITMDPNLDETKLHSGKYTDAEIIAGVIRAAEKKPLAQLEAPVISEESFEVRNCCSKLTKREIPTDGKDCLFLSLICAGIHEESAARMRLRLASSVFLRKVANTKQLMDNLLTGECGEAALLPVVSYEYGVAVCLHVNGEHRLYGAGGAIVHISYSNCHYEALVPEACTLQEVSTSPNAVELHKADKCLATFEESMAPYVFLDVDDDKERLVDTYVFLHLFPDVPSCGWRVFDPIGQCSSLFSNLHKYMPVVYYSGPNLDGELSSPDARAIYGGEGLGYLYDDTECVINSLLQSAINCHVAIINFEDYSSTLKYSKPHSPIHFDKLLDIMNISMASLINRGRLILRVASNDARIVRAIHKLSQYFGDVTSSTSPIAKQSCINVYFIFSLFKKFEYISDMRHGRVLGLSDDLTSFRDIEQVFNGAQLAASRLVENLEGKFEAIKGNKKRYDNLLRIESLRRKNDVSSIFVRAGKFVGGGLEFNYEPRIGDLFSKTFVKCDACFTGIDDMFQTGVVSSQVASELCLSIGGGACMCVTEGDDATYAESEDSLVFEDVRKSIFSELVQDVERVHIDVEVESASDENEEPRVEDSFDFTSPKEKNSVIEGLSLAAEEAKQLLHEEGRALTEQCVTLWECIKNKCLSDMISYVRASNTQFLLLRGAEVIARPTASNNIHEYNYVYSVDKSDLVKVEAFRESDKGFGIVTEKCCPFLAYDILVNLNKHKFSLNMLKTVEFIQAIPGAGKTYTMIQEHDPKRALLVTQTKSGRDDLRARVRRKFGDIDVKHCVTTASILVNGSKRYEDVYFDEAAQQHAGFAAYVASLTQCSKMICIGDRRQIPFIVRVDSFVCNYQNLWEMVPTVRNLTKTYRLASSQLRLVSPFYKDVVDTPITANREADTVIRVYPYSDELLQQAVHGRKYSPGTQSYVVLTFTQGEKADVLAKLGIVRNSDIHIEGFKGVYTMGEFQGQEADCVVVVRKTNNNKHVAIYNDESQLTVAVSRNKESLIYLTTCMEDGLASRIIEFNRLLGGGCYMDAKPCFRVKPGSLRDVPNNCVRVNISDKIIRQSTVNVNPDSISSMSAYMKKFLRSVPKSSKIFISDNIYDKFDGEALNTILPKMFDGYEVIIMSNKQFTRNTVIDMEEAIGAKYIAVDDDVIPKYNVSMNIEAEDVADTITPDVESLQSYYNSIFPLSAYRPYFFDKYEVNSMVVSPPFSDLSVRMNPTDYVNDLKETMYLTPLLETHMGDKRLNSLQEQLLGLYKRNANVSPTSVTIDYKRQVNDLLLSFNDAFEGDYTVSVSRSDVMEWLNDKGKAQVLAVERELSEVMDFSRWVMMIKTDVKPSLTDDVFLQYPAVQTILYNSKIYNALFAPFLNKLRLRLLRLLKTHIFILSDGNVEDFQAQINDNTNLLKGDVLEMDMGKFDKSQGLTALLFECEVFRKAGMDTWMINLWFLSHFLIRVKGFGTSIRLSIPHQRRSGDPWTYGGNTFFLLAILLKMCGNRLRYLMVSGDDSLAFGDFPLDFRKSLCERVARDYLFDVKLCVYESKYFCSKFLIKTLRGYVLLPDPVKILIKLGRKDLRDYEHVEEYRISLIDLTKGYADDESILLLSKTLLDRYPNCKCTFPLVKAIYSVIRNREAFHSLYKASENHSVCAVLLPGVDRKIISTFVVVGNISQLKMGEKIVISLNEQVEDAIILHNIDDVEEEVTNRFSLKQDHDAYQKFTALLLANVNNL